MTAREELYEALLCGAQHWMAAGEDPAEANRLIDAYRAEILAASVGPRQKPYSRPPHGDTTPRECPHAVEITRLDDREPRYICGCPPDDRPVSLEKGVAE